MPYMMIQIATTGARWQRPIYEFACGLVVWQGQLRQGTVISAGLECIVVRRGAVFAENLQPCCRRCSSPNTACRLALR